MLKKITTIILIIFIFISGCSKEADERTSQELQEKIQNMQQDVQSWLQAGNNPSQLQPLTQQLDQHLRIKDFEEAEMVVDQILSIVSTTPQPQESKKIEAEPKVDEEKHISASKKVKLSKIPDNAEIAYHQNGYIYVMDSEGENVQQITFENPRPWEHVAVSYDHRYVIGNYHDTAPSQGTPHSKLVLFDLEEGTEAKVVEDEFVNAGGGGIAWGPEGFIYFSASKEERTDHDAYRIKYDGTGLQRLSFTSREERVADVSVSRDGNLIAYVLAIPTEEITEIWVANSDGTNHRRVYKAGKVQIASAHDPEITDDNKKVVFSIYNTNVEPNFPNIPGLNTAHDLWSIDIDGNLDTLTRITKPGPISIIPNIKDDLIVYTEIDGKRTEITSGLTNVPGDAAVVSVDCKECKGKIISLGANTPKWIP